MVEINMKSLIIGMALGALLNSNLSHSFCKTSPVFFETTSSTSDDAPPIVEQQQVVISSSSSSSSGLLRKSSSSSPTKVVLKQTPSSLNEIEQDQTKKQELFTQQIGSTFVPNELFQSQYNEMDMEDMTTKCKRYGMDYDATTTNNNKTRRRLFFGSMVANDAIELLRMHATEVYGLYDVMVLSESNTTHMATPRKMRFTPGQVGHEFVYSGAFGPSTKVYMSYWLEDEPNLRDMPRERTQRNTIVDGWKEAGMKEDDIGIMSDMDETFTRDYLLAMKHCVLPDYMLDNSCKTMKTLGASLVFQSSPECISQKQWYHPDWALGQCIEGIATAAGGIPRAIRKRHPTDLVAACGGGNFCPGGRDDLYDEDQIMENKYYPLSSGTDIRELPQGRQALVKENQQDNNKNNNHHYHYTHTAYHFHNMFGNLKQLRHKYATYAHGSESVAKRPLGFIELDLDIAVRCAHDYPNEIMLVNQENKGRGRYTEGYEKFMGSKPIYFANATYVQERHATFIAMMKEDEAIWGKTYNDTYVEEFYKTYNNNNNNAEKKKKKNK